MSGCSFSACVEHRVRAREVVRVAQELRLGLAHLDALVDRDGGQVGQILARLAHLAQLRHHRRDAQLREPRALALGHRLVAVDRVLVPARFLRDLREVELDRAVVAVVRALQVLEQRLGRFPVLHLHREHRHAELELARAAVAIPQPLEHRARLGEALLLDVELRQRARGGLRVGIGGDEQRQVGDRLVGLLPRHDLGLQQRRALPPGLERQRAVDLLERRVVVAVLRDAAVVRGERDREVRLRILRIRLRELAHELVRLLRILRVAKGSG